jgi:diacylglycerol kinase family enzyme
VTVLRCAELRVSADRPFVMYADGDPIAKLPAVVRIRPRALRVLTPSPTEDSASPPAAPQGSR